MNDPGTHDQVICTDVPPDDWDDLVRSAPGAEYTHTAHWLSAACRCFPHTGALVLTVRRDQRLVAGLSAVVRRVGPLKRFDSSLEGTSGGPLLHEDLDTDSRRLLFLVLAEEFRMRRRGLLTACGLALNARSEREFGHLLQMDSPWQRHDSATAVVSLAGGIEAVEKNKLVMNKRNERNRGLRRGAEVFATKDPVWLEKYYPIYLQAARHWGIAPVPETFLEDLLMGSGQGAGDVFFTCVKLADKVIGGHLNLHLGDRVFAWNGVTDPAYARTHFPATLCFWGDMVEACRRHAQWLDFGASGVASSLLTFKKYFGAEMQERGFYTSESGAMGVVRTVRRSLTGRLPQRLANRWHDSSRGTP